MKRLIVSIFFILCVLGVFVRLKNTQKQQILQSQVSTQGDAPTYAPTPGPTKTIEDDGHTIAYNMFVASPSQIQLFSNLQDSTDSASAKTIHQCASLINAGFYTKERTHLGLFIANRKIIHPTIKSTLVDGFLTISESSAPSVSFDEPDNSPRIALQSGPVIRIHNTQRPLRLIEDKFARRSLAGVTSDGAVVFLTVYFKDQEYSGPLLSRTPYILEKIMSTEQLDITDAMNLDGGSASAFISNEIALTEISPIGGFFCIK